MKIFPFIFLFAFLPFLSQAQVMKMDDETTDVTFKTRHLLGLLEGTVTGVNGTAVLDTNQMNQSYLRFALSPATFIHNENYVGPNLFKESCFDVKRNPEINLVSSSITKLKGVNNYQFKGALIVKGKSRDISFSFTAVPNIGGFDYVFQFPINKKMYELKCAFGKEILIKVRAYGKRISQP